MFWPLLFAKGLDTAPDITEISKMGVGVLQRQDVALVFPSWTPLPGPLMPETRLPTLHGRGFSDLGFRGLCQ